MKYYLAVVVFAIVYFVGSFTLMRQYFGNEYANDAVLSFEEYGAYLVYFFVIFFFAHISATFYFSRPAAKKKGRATIEPPEEPTAQKVGDVIGAEASTNRIDVESAAEETFSKKKR